jgi:hypothetical protein
MRGDWGIMFNNINDNNLLNLNNTNNVINLNKIRSNIQKNGYASNPYVDKTEISSDAMKMFQRDLDIKKFAKIAAENPEDLSYMQQIQELFSDGVVDPFEESAVVKLTASSKLWDDLNS